MTVYLSTWARQDHSTKFRILYVCVANQCRSPMAERLTRHMIAGWPDPGVRGWAVESAGVKAMDGHPMHRLASRTLRSLDVDAQGFRSRQLTWEAAIGASLILAATSVERDRTIAQVPATLPKAFTLLEFARLIEAVPPGAAAAEQDPGQRALMLIDEARKMRGRVPYVEPAEDDVADPPRTPAGFERCATVIARAVNRTLAGLCGTAAEVSAAPAHR